MWKAPILKLSALQKKLLKQIANSRSQRSDQMQRAKLVLLFHDGYFNIQAGQQVGLKRRQAGNWRFRWLDNQDKLLAIESAPDTSPRDLMQCIIETLGDLPRCGTAPTFTAEQIAQILTVACEDPLESGLPFSHWTLSLLQREVIGIGIVDCISVSRLQYF